VSYFLAASLRCQASSVAGVTGKTAGRALGWRGLVQGGACAWRAPGVPAVPAAWPPAVASGRGARRVVLPAGWTAECGWRAAGYTGLLGGWKPS
jgi:hypothetical protein